MRLLLVEDSVRLQELLGERLRGADYSLDMVETARDARAAAEAVQYALYIIDLGLPDDDGITLIQDLRSQGCNTPILVITSRARTEDRIVGLDSGADDYLVKPFSHLELLARIRALLRRPPIMNKPVTQVGRIVFDETRREVCANGQVLELRAGERRLLGLLMRHVGHVVPRELIEEYFSEFGREVSGNAVEAHVSRLRKVLDEIPSGVMIETIRGSGYALKETSA